MLFSLIYLLFSFILTTKLSASSYLFPYIFFCFREYCFKIIPHFLYNSNFFQSAPEYIFLRFLYFVVCKINEFIFFCLVYFVSINFFSILQFFLIFGITKKGSLQISGACLTLVSNIFPFYYSFLSVHNLLSIFHCWFLPHLRMFCLNY